MEGIQCLFMFLKHQGVCLGKELGAQESGKRCTVPLQSSAGLKVTGREEVCLLWRENICLHQVSDLQMKEKKICK